MEEYKNLVCMSVTTKILRLHGVFPPNSDLKTRSMAFYLTASCLLIYGSIILVGAILHLAKNAADGTYNYLEVDLMNIITMLSAYVAIISFLKNIGSLIHLFVFFSDFEKFGKPVDFDRMNKSYNRYSTLQYANWIVMVLSIMRRSEVFNGDRQRECAEKNEKYDHNEICGLYTKAWLPFNIDFVPVKQIIICTQLFSVFYMYITAGVISWTVLEGIEHIIVRLRHVSQCFAEALDESDPTRRRRKFISTVKLDVYLNNLFSLFMFTHMLVTGGILGTGAYGYIKMGDATSLTVAVGWMFGLIMDCRCGQRIQDESLKIGADLMEANWISHDTRMKRDMMFVLMRCRKPMLLKATSFGVMSHAMLLAVLKASYTYVNLLSQSGE